MSKKHGGSLGKLFKTSVLMQQFKDSQYKEWQKGKLKEMFASLPRYPLGVKIATTPSIVFFLSVFGSEVPENETGSEGIMVTSGLCVRSQFVFISLGAVLHATEEHNRPPALCEGLQNLPNLPPNQTASSRRVISPLRGSKFNCQLSRPLERSTSFPLVGKAGLWCLQCLQEVWEGWLDVVLGLWKWCCHRGSMQEGFWFKSSQGNLVLTLLKVIIIKKSFGLWNHGGPGALEKFPLW